MRNTKRRTAASKVPVGARVEVWGFIGSNPDQAAGQYHQGRVLRVETYDKDYLDTAVIYTDGRMIRARNYAAAYVLEEAA